MEECPPTLIVFEMQRSTADGVTTSTGLEQTPTRLVVVNYRDNRTSHVETLWLEGEASLTNSRPVAATVRYRHRVPLGVWMVPRVSSGSPVCFEGGVVVGSWDARLDAGESVTIDIGWSVDLVDRADLNQDGVVDAVDLGLLVAAFGLYDVREDLNQDGVVDGGDLGWLFLRWSD